LNQGANDVAAQSARNILVIENDELVCRIVTRVAANLGAGVTVTSDGKQATQVLSAARPDHFDAIVLDLVLPMATGWDVLDFARTNPVCANTPVIVISGAQLSNEERLKLAANSSMISRKDGPALTSFERTLESALASRGKQQA